MTLHCKHCLYGFLKCHETPDRGLISDLHPKVDTCRRELSNRSSFRDTVSQWMMSSARIPQHRWFCTMTLREALSFNFGCLMLAASQTAATSAYISLWDSVMTHSPFIHEIKKRAQNSGDGSTGQLHLVCVTPFNIHFVFHHVCAFQYTHARYVCFSVRDQRPVVYLPWRAYCTCVRLLFKHLLAASECVSSRCVGVTAGLPFPEQMCPGVACTVTHCSPDAPQTLKAVVRSDEFPESVWEEQYVKISIMQQA